MATDADPWSEEFVRYLHSGEYSDFTIRCQEYEWKVHRIIISAVSPYFRRVTSGPFMEASKGHVDLSDDEPLIVARLILFMYFGQHPYNAPIETKWQTSQGLLLGRPQAATFRIVLYIENETLSKSAKLAAAADKYQMPRSLMEGCQRAYMERIWRQWEGPCFLLIIPEFIASIRIIYQTAPAAGLRGRAITTAQYKMTELQCRQDFKELMLATPEFAYDVAAKGLRQTLWCYRCREYVEFQPYQPPIGHRSQCPEVWDWIDHGKRPRWSTFVCRLCGDRETLLEERPCWRRILEKDDDSP